MAINPEDVSREDGESKGRYVYRLGADAAEMTYSKAGAKLLIIDHTEVPPAFRGQGVGPALVARGVADARAEGKRILPLCTFAAAQFRRHPEWADVLDARKPS
jgi:predicted GNAT family acetyltransferase